jgi:protein phosphatase
VGRDPEKGENTHGFPVVCEYVTTDHKPDTAPERERIEQSGGSVEYLHNHNNKPFIRGGDFTMRKALGEQPMQLQYSRAFGGKDLKMFGLSSVPDVRVLPIKPNTRWLILATDGLWDVCNAQQAVVVAHQARAANASPAESLVRAALQEQERRQVNADNVTAVCVYFEPH